jgi:hypothetical protein
MSEQLHLPIEDFDPTIATTFKVGRNMVIVPVATPTNIVAQTLKYAKSISQDVVALHIATDEADGQKVAEKWHNWNPGVELVTVYSPYRLVIQPLLDYVIQLEHQKEPEDYITILIPEFQTKKWWHRLLHNQTGWVLRTLLILKENVIVTSVPFHLKK